MQTDEPSTRAWSTQTLHVINGPVSGARVRVDRPEMLLGTDASFSPFGADSGLSRRHALLRHNSEGALVIQDMGSTNGTYVNGARVRKPTDVNPGDEIGPGATRPRFTDDTTAAGTSALPPNDSANPAQEIERARQLCPERRYEDAESLCARIAATPPYQSESHFGPGMVRYAVGDLVEAEKLFTHCLDLSEKLSCKPSLFETVTPVSGDSP